MELDGLSSTVMPPPAVTLTFDLLIQKLNQICLQAKVHSMSPNFGEISSNSYEDIVFTRFSGSLHVVTLTFDPKM